MTLFNSKKKRQAELQQRTERMGRILLAAGVDAMDKDLSIGSMFPGVMEQAQSPASRAAGRAGSIPHHA